MSQFEHLQDPHVREVLKDAEAALYSHPLHALVRVRQVFEKRGWKFHHPWHEVIHGRVGWMDRRQEFQAAHAALREDHRQSGAARPWQTPAKPVRACSIDRWLAELSDLDDRTNRHRPSSEGVIDVEGIRKRAAQIGRSVEKAQRRGELDDSEVLAVEIWRALVNQSLANHSGDVLSEDPREAELVQRGLEGSSHVQLLALELANRRCIARTNALDFEHAWLELDSLRERFIGSGEGRNSTLGALLGSLGQGYGFLAHVQQDPSQCDAADECFREAKRHFEEPADLERQETYLLHSACERLRHGGERVLLEQLVADRSPAISTWRSTGVHEVGRIDYPLAAWLKGHRLLGLQVPDHAGLCEVWKRTVHPESERVVAEGLSHGLILATGYLAVTSPGSPPRWLVKLLETADGTGLLGWIAGAFLAELDPRRREGWGSDRPEKLGPADPGKSPLDLVPFNFV